MDYAEHRPCAALAPYVACFWTMTSDGAPHRVLPDGCMDLLFSVRGGAQIIGTMTRAIVTPPGEPSALVGVRFRPGSAFAFFGFAAREIRDDVVEARDALGPIGRELEARVGSAEGLTEALRVVERELLAWRGRAKALEPRLRAAIAAIEAARGSIAVASVAAMASLSERQMERLFDERVGIGPKAFARVERMRAALAKMDGSAPWAAIAADLGYADQAHLIRELKALTGVTPAEYARSRRMSDLSNPR